MRGQITWGGHLNFNLDFEIFEGEVAKMTTNGKIYKKMQLLHGKSLGRNSGSTFTLIKDMQLKRSQCIFTMQTIERHPEIVQCVILGENLWLPWLLWQPIIIQPG